MIDETFLNARADAFPDFWNRRVDAAQFEFQTFGYGYEICFQTNHRAVLDAIKISAGRYPRAQALPDHPKIQIRVLVIPSLPATPIPENMSELIQTVGVGDLLVQAVTPWLQWVTDISARTCTMVISEALAREPWQLSRSILDRAMLNLLVREGVAQLHSTTLVRDECALLFIAPHGTGKSTTAFHLLNHGFRLMGDGLLFEREVGDTGKFELMGYPVGEAKLTTAAKPLFPEWDGEGLELTAHGILKHIVNLRAIAPHKMIDTSVVPQRTILCLAERNGQPHTTAERLNAEETFTRVLPDTIFWDEPEAMLRSLHAVRRLIEHSDCYKLTLGADREQLVRTILELANQD